MEKLFFLLTVILFISCNEVQQSNVVQPVQTVRTPVCKVVKSLKEKTKQVTQNEYEYDWLNSQFKLMPNIHTVTEYIIVYTNDTYDKVSYDEWIILSETDTICK